MRNYTAAGGIRGSVGWYKEALTTTDQFAAAIARGKLTLPVMGMRLPLTLAAEQEDDGKKVYELVFSLRKAQTNGVGDAYFSR